MSRPAPQADLPLGPLLRLEGLDFDLLPSRDSSIAIITPFVENLLGESLNFLASVDAYDINRGDKRDPSGWKPKGSVKYSGEKDIGGPSECAIELLEKTIPKSKLKAAIAKPAAIVPPAGGGDEAGNNEARVRRSTNPIPETWACRRSIHNNEAVGGTASWREFVRYMKIEHVETEREMTPTVPRAQVSQNWVAATLIKHIILGESYPAGPRAWTRFTLRIVEMEHDLKQPGFDHRVFPVLQMTCRSVEEEKKAQFLVISVPINDWKGVAPPDPERADTKVADGPNITIGSYVSVERFRLVRKGEDRAAPLKKVEWVMATASHARGMLPLMIQTPFVPKKIAIDVPLFLKFMVGARQKAAAAPANNALVEEEVTPEAETDPAAYAEREADAYALAFGLIDTGLQPVANEPVGTPQTGPQTGPQAEPQAAPQAAPQAGIGGET
ncbi:hypothetical protein Sste5346_007415 [Sporothrix stenoceras]|uniref:DUF3074 domain-containing protein n=1 Tax=Sporothrix stenoceras TaxID=5173 RepID=A0ABR3YVL0_9PEZI